MKKLLLLSLFLALTANAQVTNFIWSASYTSNYIRTNVLDKLNQIVLNSATTNTPGTVSNLISQVNRPYGFLSLYTQATVTLDSGVFAVIPNYQVYGTNSFTHSLTDGSLTNTTAGEFWIFWQTSFSGGNNDAIEAAIFTNTVECTLSSSEITFAATATKSSFSGAGVVSLPANCRIDVRIKNTTDGDDVTVERVQLIVKQ